MNILMFLAALAVITLGHFFRIRRWKSFISVYEDSHDSDLMFCTGIGYLVDNVLPFHVGDIVRAAIIGKKLKNGAAFSLAVIIIDRILDVFVVAYNVPLVKTQMKKIIVTAKTLYSHPKNVSKIYAALHTDLAW